MAANGVQDSNGTFAIPKPSQNGTSTIPPQGMTADEIALYDRQIRLWGVQAQERIRSAKVLLISVKALGTEIAKNLVLGGIESLTIVDNGIVTDDDLGAQYFLRDEDIGKNRSEAAVPRIQELNPRVSVIADTSNIQQKDQNFYLPFDMVIASDLDFATFNLVNAATRMAVRPFYATGIHGFYGFIFADLIEHEFTIERETSNVTTQLRPESATRFIVGVTMKKENGKNIETVTKKETYSHIIVANTSPLPPDYVASRRKLKAVTPLLPALRALWDFERSTGRLPSHSRADLELFTSLANQKLKDLQMPLDALKSDFLRSFLHNLGSELVPTAAFVGGRLAEDVINVLGKREQPIQNLALFDGENFQGPIYALHSENFGETLPGAAQSGSMNGMLPLDGNVDLTGASMLPMDPMSGFTGLYDSTTMMAGNGAGLADLNGSMSMSSTGLMDPSLMAANGFDMTDPSAMMPLGSTGVSASSMGPGNGGTTDETSGAPHS